MTGTDALEIVSFTAGGYRFAVEARQVKARLHAPADPLVSAETLLGLPAAEATRRVWLRIGEHCVEVGAPVDIRLLPAEQLFPLPELVAARLQIKGVRALALETQESDGAMLLVDLQRLLAQR